MSVSKSPCLVRDLMADNHLLVASKTLIRASGSVLIMLG